MLVDIGFRVIAPDMMGYGGTVRSLLIVVNCVERCWFCWYLRLSVPWEVTAEDSATIGTSAGILCHKGIMSNAAHCRHVGVTQSVGQRSEGVGGVLAKMLKSRMRQKSRRIR